MDMAEEYEVITTLAKNSTQSDSHALFPTMMVFLKLFCSDPAKFDAKIVGYPLAFY